MRVCTRRVVGSTCKMFVKIRNVLWRLTCSPGRGDGENIEQRAHAVRVYRTRKYTSACTFRRKPLVLTKYGTFRIVPRTRVRVRARGVPEAQRLIPVAVWSGGSVERHRTIYIHVRLDCICRGISTRSIISLCPSLGLSPRYLSKRHSTRKAVSAHERAMF